MFKVRLFVLALANFLLSHSGFSTTFVDDFSSNPVSHGWKIAGQTNLFQWDSSSQNVRVTWDSSQPNSYFYYSLGTILTRYDDFSVAFDLRLADVGAGPDTNKATSFPIGIGFLNLDQATKTNFIRGTGTDSPNLVEFSYFWDSGFGATSWPVLVDTNSTFNFNGASDYAIFALTPGDLYHIAMSYSASNQTIVATITNSNGATGARITQPLGSGFTDFRAGSFSLSSYSDAGQDPQFAGSVLAHGTVDNVMLAVPAPPLANSQLVMSNGTWGLQVLSGTNWIYALEKTFDFRFWTPASSAVSGTGTNLILFDTNSLAAASGFYRVRANRP